MSNKSTDFSHPINLQGDGRSNVICEITLKPHLNTNKNSIYYSLNNGSFTNTHNKVGPGTYSISIPSSWFNRNNAILTVQVDTYDSKNQFVSGSFGHAMLLLNPNYKNYVCNFLYPTKTYPGEICTINILPPHDSYANGLVYDVDINYHRDVGRETISTNRGTGKFSFVVPALAINSSLTVRVTTKDKKTGSVLGTMAQSIKVEKTVFNAPQIILPDNYMLSITEGVNAKVKGTSQNINDYMLIYAKKYCDVASAVSKYTTSDSYYAASKSELKTRLLENATGNLEYYVLKNFDDSTTFVTQDASERNVFHIRTPATNQQQSFEDFYALQWFKNVKPSDILYLYAIERGSKRMNTAEAPTTKLVKQISMSNWKCDHCQLSDYRYWNISQNWNPYGRITTSEIKTIMNQYQDVTLKLRITMDRTLNHPPNIYITNTSSNSEAGAVYLSPVSQGPSTTFDYTVPVYYVVNQISNGQSYLWLHTHWGKNTNVSQARYLSGVIDIRVKENAIDPSVDDTYNIYTDNNYNNITKIPVSSMTPYIVLPPAVKPVELTVEEQSSRQLTISYSNPLYGESSNSLDTYEELGSINFDMSSGDDINDLSDLNEMDYTLNINELEERKLTYEKKVKLAPEIIDKINKMTTNDIYIDLKLTSVDSRNLNFVPIINNDIKVQVMLSNNDNNKTRVLDLNSDIIDLKKQEYDIKKIYLNKSSLPSSFDTMHFLYNVDPYDQGKSFAVQDRIMVVDDTRVTEGVGWRRYNGTTIGSCFFSSDTYDVSRYALGFYHYEIRLCLENLIAEKELYKAPKVVIKHRSGDIQLNPDNLGVIKPGEDITYKIPKELYDVMYDEILDFTLSPELPYPIDTPDIDFTNAYIEVIGMESIDAIAEKYSSGFTASMKLLQAKKQTTNSNVSLFDPVQCIDVVLCCYDSSKNLINKTSAKRRDLYNGKEFIYYTDRKWHNFFNEKYKNNIRYKPNYKMTFNIPDGTKYIYAFALTYGNWHDNPSIYSMSNIVAVNSVKQDLSLEFVNPVPTVDELDNNLLYANVNRNNPIIGVKVYSRQYNTIELSNDISGTGFNLAEDDFNIEKWRANPLIYSINKQYGYEQPVFNAIDLYRANNAASSLEPLYNSIEYYSQWRHLYGDVLVYSPNHDKNSDIVDIQSTYTIYEDEGDKFISNGAVPYIEIPATLIDYDRTKISLFLDIDFGINTKPSN